MRNYEIAIIFQSDLDEAAMAALTERIEGWIAGGGAVHRVDRWGTRKLAYEIQKKREGFYIFWYATLMPDQPREIERNLRLLDEVLRYMVIRIDALPVAAAEEVAPQTTDGAEVPDEAPEEELEGEEAAEEIAEDNADEDTVVDEEG